MIHEVPSLVGHTVLHHTQTNILPESEPYTSYVTPLSVQDIKRIPSKSQKAVLIYIHSPFHVQYMKHMHRAQVTVVDTVLCINE